LKKSACESLTSVPLVPKWRSGGEAQTKPFILQASMEIKQPKFPKDHSFERVIWEHPDAKVGMNSFPARNKSHFHIANSKAALRKRIPSRVNKVYSPDEEFSGSLGTQCPEIPEKHSLSEFHVRSPKA